MSAFDPGRAVPLALLVRADKVIEQPNSNVFCGWLPHCKGQIEVLALVGCSLLSGLLMQSSETAGPDGVREQGPILLIRL
jgi:hypothetical protein